MADGPTSRRATAPPTDADTDAATRLTELSEAIDALVSCTAVEAPLMVCSAAVRLLECHGAAVLLGVDPEQLKVVAASDELAGLLARLQLALPSGPALAAIRTGRTVELDGNVSPSSPEHPYLSRARDVGVVRSSAVPLRCDGTLVGTLDLYHDRPGSLTADQRAIAETLASVGAKVIVSAERLRRSRDIADAAREQVAQLQVALDSRVLIEQAKGVLSAQLDVDTDDAFELLRRHARNHGAPLHEVARQVVAGTLPLEDVD